MNVRISVFKASASAAKRSGSPKRSHLPRRSVRCCHFKKDVEIEQPRVLLVAPMSGHFSTLLRGTAKTLLADHDVYITDWHNAQNVSLVHGNFDFDDFVDHLIDMTRFIGPGAHIVAVCQPAVPVVVAVSLMAADNDPAQPASMTLMGGPIDCRRNPTQVNVVGTSHPIDWFERNVIGDSCRSGIRALSGASIRGSCS